MPKRKKSFNPAFKKLLTQAQLPVVDAVSHSLL